MVMGAYNTLLELFADQKSKFQKFSVIAVLPSAPEHIHIFRILVIVFVDK